MSFIEVAIGEAQEKEVLPEGEYDLVIEAVDSVVSRAGNPMLSIRLNVENEPTASTIFHNLILPTNSDDSEKKNVKLLFVKSFLDTFDIPHSDSGFDPIECPGHTGRCLLTQEEYNGTVSNRIKLRI